MVDGRNLEARVHYQSQVESLQAQIDAKEKWNRIFSLARPLFFFPAIILLLAGYTRPSTPTVAIWLGWILAGGFMAALFWHESVRFLLEQLHDRCNLYRRLIARLDRRWGDIPFQVHPSSKLNDFQDATAEDLDLFGKRSLFHWLSLASTSIGQRRLAQWCVRWEEPSVMEARQKGVIEFRDQRDERESILFLASRISNVHAAPENFLAWAQSSNWLKQHSFSHLWSWIGPLLILCGLIGFLIANQGEAPNQQWIGLGIVALGLIGNILLMLGKVGAIHDLFQNIQSGHREVDGYRELFHAMSRLDGQSTMIARIRIESGGSEHAAVPGFSRLRLLVTLANLQRNSLLYIPYLLLQIVLQWDFRILELLERWKKSFGRYAGGWLDALADCEALISAATIADEYPKWAFPIWKGDGVPVEAKNLSHPLLPDNKRVGNDLTIEANRPLLLITGSNMAGKSTLLRSLGLNLILARTGAPVCADSFVGRPFELATSIHVQDSLQDGVSYFMAELYRLRDVVEQARLHHTDLQRPLLALLDEILQGTNSRERQIAVQQVISQLIGYNATTAISTHDLELADQADLVSVAQIVHFREYFEEIEGEQRMKFDYIMRSGPTPTTNALKLLEIVGLHRPPNPLCLKRDQR